MVGHRLAGFAVMVTCLLAATPPAAVADPVSPKESPEDVLYRQGETAFKLGQFREAAKAFEEAYKLAKAPTILFAAAQSYRMLYDHDRHMSDLANAVQLYRTFIHDAEPGHPKLAAAQKWLTALDRELTGRRAERARELENASGSQALDLAEQLLSEGSPQDAALLLDRMLEVRAQPRKLYLGTLQAHARAAGARGERAIAVADFTRVLALEPSYRLPAGADPVTSDAFLVAKALWTGKPPLTLRCEPPGASRPGWPIVVHLALSDVKGLVRAVRVQYRKRGARAFESMSVSPSVAELGLPAAFSRGLVDHDAIEIIVQAVDERDNELVSAGSVEAPLRVRIAQPGRPRLVAGIISASVGAALASTGVYFGLRSVSRRDSLDNNLRTPASWTATDQLLYEGGKSDAKRANILLVAGGALLVAGGGLCLWEYVSGRIGSGHAEVVPLSGGGAITLSGRF